MNDKPNTPPLCQGCLWWQPDANAVDGHLDLCTNIRVPAVAEKVEAAEAARLVRGIHVPDYNRYCFCSNMRMFSGESYCNREGRFFEPKGEENV